MDTLMPQMASAPTAAFVLTGAPAGSLQNLLMA